MTDDDPGRAAMGCWLTACAVMFAAGVIASPFLVFAVHLVARWVGGQP